LKSIYRQKYFEFKHNYSLPVVAESVSIIALLASDNDLVATDGNADSLALENVPNAVPARLELALGRAAVVRKVVAVVALLASDDELVPANRVALGVAAG
jgi:hypothetical protein